MIDYGLELAGFETAFQVEIDPACRKVLERHWSGVPRFRDVRECGRRNLEPVDLLSGGFPCINISSGGRRKGLGTPDRPTKHSGLWYEFHRIIGETRPPWVFIENVSRLLHTDAGDRVLSDMEGEGYSCWPLMVGARMLGAPHERKRAWILCHRGDADHEGHPGDGVEPGELLPAFQRALEEAREHWQKWEHELASGDGGQGGGAAEPEADAYARIMRAVSGDPHWMDRYRMCGNSAVWIVPALVGQWVARTEGRREHGQGQI
jgi:DNA (cytosine-5)-methyltransferase 1